jgi:hypothetical protein
MKIKTKAVWVVFFFFFFFFFFFRYRPAACSDSEV